MPKMAKELELRLFWNRNRHRRVKVREFAEFYFIQPARPGIVEQYISNFHEPSHVNFQVWL